MKHGTFIISRVEGAKDFVEIRKISRVFGQAMRMRTLFPPNVDEQRKVIAKIASYYAEGNLEPETEQTIVETCTKKP